MKILVDVDQLEQDGVITPPMAAMLRTHANRATGSTAINMLLAFGAIAMAMGILTLVPSESAAALFGLGFILAGCIITKRCEDQWGKLGSIWMIIGALLLTGAIGTMVNHPLAASLIAVFILGWVSIIASSHLLMALTPLALASAVGGSTGYWHACYMLSIQEPTITIILFTVLAYAAWQLAKRYEGLLQSLAITFARMCVILVNFGFWIGSLWGDTPGKMWQAGSDGARYYSHTTQTIPTFVFIIGWAVALVFAGAWGAKQGRRFMVNTVAVFGAIHFYTQWFEHFGAHAITVIVAGAATIAFGLGLWRYNRKVLS